MTGEEQSSILFDKAIELKRKRNFNDSLKFYVKSIQVYPGDPNGMKAFNAMGKVFYLKGDFTNAVKCYTIYNRLYLLKNSSIMRDYQEMLKGSSVAENSLLNAYYNVATHLGWSKAKAESAGKHVTVNKNEQIYLNSIIGKESYSSLSKDKQLIYDQYENICRNKGYQILFDDIQEMIDNLAKSKIELNQYIEKVFATVKQLPINDTSLYHNTTTNNIPLTSMSPKDAQVRSAANISNGHPSVSHPVSRNIKKRSKIGYWFLLAFVAVVLGTFLFGTNNSEKYKTSYIPTKEISDQKDKQDPTKDISKKYEQKQYNQDKDRIKADANSLQNSPDKKKSVNNIANTDNNTSHSRNIASRVSQDTQVDIDGAKAVFDKFVYDAGSGDYQTAYSYVDPKTMSYDDFVYLNKKRKTFSQGITVTDIYPGGDGVVFRFTKATGTEGIITLENHDGWKIVYFNGVYSGID